jgi:hypothetical protein
LNHIQCHEYDYIAIYSHVKEQSAIIDASPLVEVPVTIGQVIVAFWLQKRLFIGKCSLITLPLTR